MLYSPPAWSSNAAMLKRSDVEQKSDIIVATSRFPSSRDLAKDLTKDREGLIPIPTQPEVYFVVDCPSLHIVGGNNIGPRQQSGTDVSVEFFMYGILLPQITCANRLSLASQRSTMPSVPSVSRSLPEPDRL
jgi:hypothetical protein